jgi:CTP:molybdopterin cytidylyltransferase MocA
VVIPAGGEIDGDYASLAGTEIRALAPIGADRPPVLQIVVDALRGSGKTGTIIVVGPDTLKSRIDGVDLWLPEGPLAGHPEISAGPANVLRGLRELPRDRAALVCTSDLPFLTAEAVADFVDRADTASSISAGLVSDRAYLERFPQSPESEFVSLSETGPITMGCLFCLRPDVLLDRMDLVMGAFTARKSQWGLVRLLGPKLVWQYAVRRLSLEAVRGRIERLLSCGIGIVHDAMPETAFDIDTPEDYAYANANRHPG